MSQLAPERQHVTTASRAPLLVHDGSTAVFQHWQERIGLRPPEDLSEVYAVQHGKYLEPFVLDWFERKNHVEITERQRFLLHPTIAGIGCTLDGYIAAWDAIADCKVLNPSQTARDFIPYYAPQLAVQMACRGASCAILIVQQGNSPPQRYDASFDAGYSDAVLGILRRFQDCVERRVPPGPPPPAPVPPERWRTIDLDATEVPNWGPAMRSTLGTWASTRTIAEEHATAKAAVKALLPDDVGRVMCGDILVRRSSNGAVSIVEAAP